MLQKKIKNEWLPQEQEPVSSFGAEFKSKSDLMLLGFQHTSGVDKMYGVAHQQMGRKSATGLIGDFERWGAGRRERGIRS